MKRNPLFMIHMLALLMILNIHLMKIVLFYLDLVKT